MRKTLLGRNSQITTNPAGGTYEQEAKARQGERTDLKDSAQGTRETITRPDISQKIDQSRNTGKATEQAARDFGTKKVA